MPTTYSRSPPSSKISLSVPLAPAQGVAVQRLDEAIITELVSIDQDDDLALAPLDCFFVATK